MAKLHKITNVISCSILSVVILSNSVIPVQAYSASELEKRQQQLQYEMKQKQKQIQSIKSKEKNVYNDLKSITEDIGVLNKDITYLDNRIDSVEDVISETKNHITIKQEEVDERAEILGNRIRNIYMEGQANSLEFLLGSTSFSDFTQRFDFLRKIAQNDERIYSELEQERETLDEKKGLLEQKRKQIEDLKKSKVQNKEKLQTASSRQKSILSQVKKERSQLEKMLDEMEGESEKLAQELMKLASKGTFSGKLIWPTPGYSRITSPYGYRIHPITKTKRFHSGIDIAAPSGSKVIAASSGKVIFVGWRGAYGRTIVVDHGGLTTMYPHLSSALVKVGQKVSQGQQIGKVGSTGWSTGPHLHFEIRVNGKSVNPFQYVK